MSSIITAEHLRSLREKRRRHDLDQTVDLITQEYVIPAAQKGETSVLIKQHSYQSRHHIGYPIVIFPSLPNLVEALQARFPDTIITVGSTTTILQNGVFDKNDHILMDWSAPLPPAAPTKGCREMSKCFIDGQRIRHVILRNNQTLYATYDAQRDRLVLEDGKTFAGPCGVANEHYKRHGFAHGHRDGWGECECEVNGKWVSTYSLPG
jgi:hypothetical protein